MKIGSRVTTRHGYTGVVVRMYDDFSAVSASCVSMSGTDWLAQQIIPFTEDELAEAWYSVACDDGGSVWSPKSLLDPI